MGGNVRELLPAIDAWRAEGTGFGRAVLIRSFGSAPRPEGATLLVADDGRLQGSVSGGCVEGACVDEVLRARSDGTSRVVRFGITDAQAWDVGLACGSTIDVLIEPSLRPEAEAAARTAEPSVVATRLPAASPTDEDGPHPPGAGEPGPVTVVRSGEGVTGAGGTTSTDRRLLEAAALALARRRSTVVALEGEQYFLEVFPTPPRVLVFGAVQVALPLVRFAAELGYRTVVVDARAAFATRERFPDADELHVGWPDEVAELVGLAPDDSVVILTHDPKLDEPAIVAALRAGCQYVGAIGSRRTQAARRKRLVEAGLTSDEIDELHAPIGLDLGGRDPSEIALAIMAEVVATRNAASGRPLVANAAGEPVAAAAG